MEMKALKAMSILLVIMFLTSTIAIVATKAVKPGDVDGDGHVGLTDLALTAQAWHSHAGDSNWDDRCDWNGDGFISLADLAWVAVNYEG